MTFHEFVVYYEQQTNRFADEMKLHERFAGRICALIANASRDTKKRRKPYGEEDFIAGQKKKMSPEQFATMLKIITACNGGEENGEPRANDS